MKQPLVTVVLPIYNVEKYLDRCIESVVNQTYNNLEILMIDDGSPDRCPQMCEEWAKKDPRIRVIHKKNQGLGHARNTGIEYATGQYICFFDSDDYIRKDTAEKALAQITKEQADVVLFGYSSVGADGRIVSEFSPGVGYKTYRGASVKEEFLPDFVAPNPSKKEPRAFYMSACMAMYAIDIIRESGWRFVSERDIISEDVYSLLDLARHLRCVTVIPDPLYFYCDNGASLSRRYLPGRYLRIRHFYQEIMRLCQDAGYNGDVLHRVSKPYLAFTLSALKQEAMAEGNWTQRMESVKEIVGDATLQKVLEENKKDVVSWTRKVMFRCMRRKWYWICFLLLKAKV